MNLENKLLESIAGCDDPVKGVWVGLNWTAVESRYVGMSHTYRPSDKVDLEYAGALTSFSAKALAKRILSWNPLEASVGIAAINSLIMADGEKGNIVDHIKDKISGKTLTVIGRFPFFPELAAIAKRAYLLEIEPVGDELPAFASEEILPQSDINLITGTTLINHSLQRLLELGSNGLNIVLGPTTPLSPVLFDFGADILAGVKVTDRNALIQGVSQGAGMVKHLRGVEQVCLYKNHL
jgi:uncharacterized protein (DUF4213/DUF364 family)